MNTSHHAFGSERGAVLVHVALAILALMALSIFVVDYGVLWASRRQAQNVADAAALAGATSFALDSKDTSSTGPAALAAQAIVQSGSVWGQIPAADILLGDAASATILSSLNSTWTSSVSTTTGACPPGESGVCVRVDVHRDTAKGNPLPTFFGAFVGRAQQSIRATATAKAAVANATDCLKPWGVVDRWAEHWPIDPGTWDATSTYDRYYPTGPLKDTILPDPDSYTAPTLTGPGTGFHPFNSDGITRSPDYGLQLALKVGNNTNFQFDAGWFAPLALNNNRGGNDYLDNIKQCVGITYQLGDQVWTEPGNKVGPTQQGVEGGPAAKDANSLINQDPTAYWEDAKNGGCGCVKGSAFAVSPRIVAVPLLDPDATAAGGLANKTGGRTLLTITNILGFFVEDYNNKGVVGRLMAIPGKIGSGPSVGPESGFMQAIILIR